MQLIFFDIQLHPLEKFADDPTEKALAVNQCNAASNEWCPKHCSYYQVQDGLKYYSEGDLAVASS